MSEGFPRVSVVVVNYRRPEDTIACLEGLRALDRPDEQLEIVVVDNASGDGSADRQWLGKPWDCAFPTACSSVVYVCLVGLNLLVLAEGVVAHLYRYIGVAG